jgi:hypothetical protein
MSFDFIFPSCEPVTPPSFSFDPSLLEVPPHSQSHSDYYSGHARSSSYGSYCSTVESASSPPSDAASTRHTTPTRSPPPVRQHGPLLLPKIRSQDQAIESPPKRVKTSPKPAQKPRRQAGIRKAHGRSFTNPETLNAVANTYFVPTQPQGHCQSMSQGMSQSMSQGLSQGMNQSMNQGMSQSPGQSQLSPSLLCSPVIYSQDDVQARRPASSGLESSALDRYGFPTYRQMPSYFAAMPQPQMQAEPFMYTPQYAHSPPPAQYTPRAQSPLDLPATSEVVSTTLMNYLTTSNPAPSLVRTISFPLRDPNTKHFWWDVRQVRSWSAFNAATILSLPGASALLHCPVPATLLPQPSTAARTPETEASLHGIYANYYLPKLNSALAISSQRPLQFSVPATKSTTPAMEHVFTANVAGEPASAAAIFGGKPTARVVGLVKSFDRFNTGMRVEGNIKRVEYLRGLAHLHHVMREHSCRYGFILTEIELVIVRNGTETTPHFGHLEVTSIQLAAAAADDDDEPKLTACLALWGLCAMAGDDTLPGQMHWKTEIGAPAEGTRRKALPRDDWMPQPQLAEKREAKRARGWVLPEDAVGRKELGKRGVKYGAC